MEIEFSEIPFLGSHWKASKWPKSSQIKRWIRWRSPSLASISRQLCETSKMMVSVFYPNLFISVHFSRCLWFNCLLFICCELFICLLFVLQVDPFWPGGSSGSLRVQGHGRGRPGWLQQGGSWSNFLNFTCHGGDLVLFHVDLKKLWICLGWNFPGVLCFPETNHNLGIIFEDRLGVQKANTRITK